jgi:hypothetical protein
MRTESGRRSITRARDEGSGEEGCDEVRMLEARIWSGTRIWRPCAVGEEGYHDGTVEWTVEWTVAWRVEWMVEWTMKGAAYIPT